MKKGEQTNCLKIGVTEVRSKILTPLETTGGNSFSQEGFEKMFFKTLRILRITFHWRNSDIFPGDIKFHWRDSDIFPGDIKFHWRDSDFFPGGL